MTQQKEDVRAIYGILSNVSLRTSRNQKAFVRATVVAKTKTGETAFTQEIICYKEAGIKLLCELGNGGSVWMLGRIKEIPQKQGRFTIKMLDAFDVRDSRKKINT